LIPGAAQAWGLSVEGCTASEPQRILDALADGKLVVALMTKGHFTKSGHFIVLRGVQDEKILVADPASYRRSQKVWDLSIILNEASRRARNYRRLSCNRQHQAFPGQALCGDAKRDAGNPERK